MRFITVFLFTIYTFLLPAQERLTSIVNEVQEELIYTQEVDGTNYVLKSNPADELSVFLLNDDFTLTHLYTNTFDDIHTDFFARVIDKFVYLIDDNEPVLYNFALDEELRYTLPEGWFPTFWSIYGKRVSVLRATNADSGESRSFYLGENGDLLAEYEGISCLAIFEDHILCSSDYVGNQRIYYTENIDSKKRDTLVLGSSFFDHRLTNEGQELVYIDKLNRFCKYDGISGEKYCIPSLTYNTSVYESYAWVDDYLILFHKNEERISLFSAIDGSLIHIINYEELVFFSTSQLYSSRIVENKLVLQTNSDVLIFDLISLELDFNYTHSTQWTVNPLIDNRYILGYDFIVEDNEWVQANKLIDLKEDTIIELNFNGPINMLDYANVIPVGDDYLGVFWTRNSIEDIAFRISPNNMSLAHTPEIQPRTSQGLPGSTTKLFKLGNGLAFVSEDIVDREVDRIYAVDGDQINLVVSESIYDFYPSGFIKLEDKLTYAVERVDQWDIYSFDGKDPTREAEIPIPSTFMGTAGQLENYVITDKNVFAIVQGLGFEIRKSLMRFDKINNTVEEVIELEDFIFNDPLVSNGEDTYFFSYSTLYHVDELGETSTMLEVEDAGIVSGVLRQSGEHIYFLSVEGVFLLDGKDAIQLYENSIDNSLLGIEFSESRDFIDRPLLFDISFEVENTILYLDGSNIREVNIGARASSINAQENNYFFVQTSPDQNGPRKFLVYDGRNDQIFDLTDFNQAESILNIHELNNNTYIITYERFTDILNIHQMSSDFAESELVFSTPFNAFTSDPNFRILDGEGMLYTNEFIFQVDQDYQFYRLDVVGNALTPEMEINEDGYIYFIATDEDFGNQLYRILLVSLRLDVEDIESVEFFDVYPNPTSGLLNLPIEIEGEFVIFNDVGQLMMQGESNTSQLDTSKLLAGSYSLQIVSDKKIFVSRFVKVDK